MPSQIGQSQQSSLHDLLVQQLELLDKAILMHSRFMAWSILAKKLKQKNFPLLPAAPTKLNYSSRWVLFNVTTHQYEYVLLRSQCEHAQSSQFVYESVDKNKILCKEWFGRLGGSTAISSALLNKTGQILISSERVLAPPPVMQRLRSNTFQPQVAGAATSAGTGPLLVGSGGALSLPGTPMHAPFTAPASTVATVVSSNVGAEAVEKAKKAKKHPASSPRIPKRYAKTSKSTAPSSKHSQEAEIATSGGHAESTSAIFKSVHPAEPTNSISETTAALELQAAAALISLSTTT